MQRKGRQKRFLNMSEMSKLWRWFVISSFPPRASIRVCPITHSHQVNTMNHTLGTWNGEMVMFSFGSAGLSSGTFPFSISTFPSITCVSTPLAAWTNFWRFQKKETESRGTRAGALLRYGRTFAFGFPFMKNKHVRCVRWGNSYGFIKRQIQKKQKPTHIIQQQQSAYWRDNARLYLCNDEAAGHAQTGLGSKMAGDHNAEAGLWEPELWRAGVHDLVHHHHRATAVRITGLHWGGGGIWQEYIYK